MSTSRRARFGSRWSPFRWLRRWARHTPNGEVALTLIALGVALVFVAVIVWVTLA